ncbi:MAG: MFS transporter [Candidatus Omnitrophota bacterium]|nr:MFS transporter [Candidatus Omnitrophota bacterium]
MSCKEGLLKGISPNIVLLGIVSFLNDVSSEMVMPILPMFITTLGGTGLIVGLVAGFRDSISSILKVFSGYWSDKAGKRKIFVTYGYLASAAFKMLLSFSKVWQHILIFTGFERVGKGLRTAPRDAIIADSMPGQRGRGFGIHRAFDTAGAILGSVVVFILFWSFRFNFKTIIFIAAFLAFFSLIPLYFVKEQNRNPQDITLQLGLKNLPRSLRLFMLICGTFALANFSYMFFILKARQIFTGRLSVGAPIGLYILFNIFYALFAVPFGNLSDKIGRRKVLILGYSLFSMLSLGFAFFKSLIAFIILFALYGLVYAMIEGNQRAYVADLSSGSLRATALGAFHTIIGLTTLPASLIAGFLWQVIAPASAFIYGAVVAVIPVGLFFIFRNDFEEKRVFSRT